MHSKIHVQFRDGSVPKGKKVEMSINGAFAKAAYTDSHGTAIIQHSSSGSAKVYVNGSTVGTFQAPGETAVFIK